MNINLDELEKECASLGQTLTPEQLEKLKAYLELLIKWNKKINLTGAGSWREALRTLILDSFYLRTFISALPPLLQDSNIWDLGSGAGLPGIPLRILWDSSMGGGAYHMIEIREKRALFLQTALAHLQPLPATFAHKADGESFMQGQRAKGLLAQVIISRAFMPWPKLLPFVKPFLAPKGILILMLGADAPSNEIDGWQILAKQEYTIGTACRHFIAISSC